MALDAICFPPPGKGVAAIELGFEQCKAGEQGAIAASIWKRQATSGFEYFDFTVSRSWKTSATGKEGYSSSFFARNADDLHAVIQEAANWMESQQASLQENNDFKNQTILQKAV